MNYELTTMYNVTEDGSEVALEPLTYLILIKMYFHPLD